MRQDAELEPAAAEPDIASLKKEVARRYGADPALIKVVLAPYRICPLGAHIDHQFGPVTAMALDRGVLLAYAPVEERQVRLSSRAFAGQVDFDLDFILPASEGDWGNFPRGAVAVLAREYHLKRGMVGITAGALSEGGLSSSAAIGVAYLLALEEVNDLNVSAEENIALDQAIENGYLGLRNGILDQAAILLSRREHLTRIECATVAHELVPRAAEMPPYAILIAFSGLRQALVTTDYNRRVDECATAARELLDAAGKEAPAPLLGHLTAAEYAAHRDRLSGLPARRAAHFFTEVDRVERGVEAWRRGYLDELGGLMTASGESSIHQYECGSPPLIDLYEILIQTEGVYGARFSGAGFRGCCVALVAEGAAEEAVEQVRREYAARQPGLSADAPVLRCRSDDGARILA